MPSYTVNEPHPTIAAGTYTHSGRGGAGNTFRVDASVSSSSGMASKPAAIPQSTRFYSGRGGAGNAHTTVARPVMSFDEEYERAVAHDTASVGHVGRGGAGNVYVEKKHRDSDAGSSRRSSADGDARSIRSGFWARISGTSVGQH